jgi:hypothetical protein
MIGTQQVQEKYDIQGNNNNDKVVIRLKVEIHIYLTHNLLASYLLS